MIHTPLCDLLGIKHPVILAGMNSVSTSELVAAVSNAGGIGTLGGLMMSPSALRQEIKLLKEELIEGMPFGVDLAFPKIGDGARKTNYDYTGGNLEELIDVTIEGGARIFVCAIGVPPPTVVTKLHDNDIIVMNMIGAPHHVEYALKAGVDVVIAQGSEGGGHTGDVGTMASIPEFNTSDRSIHAKYHVFGSPQWSREKVRSLPHIISGSSPLNDKEFSLILTNAALVPQQRTSKRKVALNSYLFYGKSEQHTSPNEFSQKFNRLESRKSNYTECQAAYRRSFFGFFRSKLEAAKKFAKQRLDKGREEAGVYDLSLSDITALYERQRGLCFYSGVKLTLKPLSNWMCSIERLANTKGYTADNVVLICSEFQTTDHSVYTKRSVSGTSQWSKEKVAILLQWLRQRHQLDENVLKRVL